MQNTTEGLEKKKLAVIGVGGAGIHALNQMINKGLSGVSFIAVDTDSRALSHSLAKESIHLVSTTTFDLGAQGNQTIGALPAEYAGLLEAKINGAELVFVVAGMGGGTGTGVACMIAKALKNIGIYSVGIVSRPFGFEGERKSKFADNGIASLMCLVDGLICIPNERIRSVSNISLGTLFEKMDDACFQTVRCISDMITQSCWGRQLEKIKDRLGEASGLAVMGTGYASGEHCVDKAFDMAFASPLLEDIDMDSVQGVILNVALSRDTCLMAESELSLSILYDMMPDLEDPLFDTVHDKYMVEEVRVTVIFLMGERAPKQYLLSTEEKSDDPVSGRCYMISVL